MNRTVTVTLMVSALFLGGCGWLGQSKLNPMNWFGPFKQREAFVLPADKADQRLLIDQVTDVKIDRYAGGAIIRATGVAPEQGWWNAELVAKPVTDDGKLVIEFRIFPPVSETPTGTPQSRQVTAALALSDIKLAPVTEIIVQGAQNARSARR